MIPLASALSLLPALAASDMSSFIFCGIQLCACSVGLVFFGFWLWMLIEVITKEPSEDKDKMMWILIVALLGAIGAAVYFFARRPKRKSMYGR